MEPELDVLLETEQTFEPPAEFAADANASDPEVYERADADPEAWWASWAEKLEWIEPWDEVLDWSDAPFAKWFAGGKLNASVNCLDRHVDAGAGDRVAFYWEGEDATRREVTYAELLEMTQRFANVLKDLGVSKGDVVGIYLPMVPEAVAAMVACTRIGAIHNVVFGGFSAESVRERMEFSEAKVLVTADATMRRGEPIPMKAKVDDVLDGMPSVERVVVVDRGDTDPPMTDGRDLFWHEAVESADPECEPEALDAEDPLYILYTSGSTGKPKGILHTTGGYLTQVSATHKLVFDLKDDDVYWCGADIGWVTGHSYIVYGPLANGATSVMYEGAPNFPAEDRWWEIIERYGVTIFEAGRAEFEKLVAGADAVVNNLRGDQPAKLQLEYKDLERIKPGIVCLHISAYGRDNSRTAWPGYDFLMQAESGLMDLTGDPKGEPARFGASVIDYMTGITGMLGLLGAVRRAHITGVGCDVDVSLFDVALHQLGYAGTWYINEGHASSRLPRGAHLSVTPVQTFKTADGWIYIMCMTDRFWASLLGVLAKPSITRDPRFANQKLRAQHRDELTEALDAAFSEQPTEHWLKALTGVLPIAPVFTVRQAFDNPFLREIDMVSAVPHPHDPEMKLMSNPLKFDGARLPQQPCRSLEAAVAE